MVGLAAVAAGLVVWWWLGAATLPWREGRRRVQRAGWVAPAGLGAVVVAVAVATGPGFAPLVLALGAVVALVWGLSVRAVRHRGLRRRADEVAQGCQVLAGQLRIGQIPGRALLTVAEEFPAFAGAAAAQGVGGEVPAALRRAASQPGHEGLQALAAAWQLAEHSGAPMAEAAEQVAEHLDQVAALRRSVNAELAPARATGKLLAVLPVIGIGMGFLVGGHPDEFLLGTVLGRWLLCAGVVLAGLGVCWTEVLADRVDRLAR